MSFNDVVIVNEKYICLTKKGIYKINQIVDSDVTPIFKIFCSSLFLPTLMNLHLFKYLTAFFF